jgi:preprotein translocase subunit YajC
MDKLLSFLPLLQQEAPAATQPAGDPISGIIMNIIPFAAIIGVFYFLIFRPQQKKQKETKNMLSNLKRGDKVVTIGGLCATIFDVKEKTVILKVDDNTKVEYLKSAISERETKEAMEKEKTEVIEETK